MQPMQPMWTWVGFITLFAMMVSMAITWEKQAIRFNMGGEGDDETQ